jgi:predicted  nucleic acid-binding Zn-ribbon protein
VHDESRNQLFQVLAALQLLDTELHQLTHRRANLPEAAELQSLQAEQARAQATRAALTETRDHLLDRQEQLATSIDQHVTRQHQLERQMQAATGTAARDLEAMDAELHRLSDLQRDLEDEALMVLEETEPIEADLEALEAELMRLEAAAEDVRGRGRDTVAEIEALRTTREGERGALVAQLPEQLLATYDQVRSRVGVVAVARLKGNRCDGCNLELPSVEVDRITKLPLEELATCDHCSRLLLRPQQLA